jgi:hypothetical protein
VVRGDVLALTTAVSCWTIGRVETAKKKKNATPELKAVFRKNSSGAIFFTVTERAIFLQKSYRPQRGFTL